jgi:hypothetical protein
VTINENLGTFAGLPVVHWEEHRAADDPSAVAWLVSIEEYDLAPDEFAAAFEGMLDRAGEGGPAALVIGQWGGAYETGPPIDLLVRLAPRMTALRSLFLGDMRFEECEISWIKQGDLAPLLAAFPRLKRLAVRGADGLMISTPLRHESLRDLELQTGGLPVAVLRSIIELELPALERLHLWLGVEDYGGSATVDPVLPFLDESAVARWPRLTELGLCDSEFQDEIAAAVATSPVVPRLRALSLAMGSLGDVGAESLLAGQPLTHLETLDLHHHFMTPPVVQRLVAALPSVRVDVGDPQEEDPEWPRRFAEVRE